MADTNRNWPLLRIYAEVVRRGLRTIEQIDEKYRADVKAILAGELAESK